MKRTVKFGKGEWWASFGIGILCIPLGIILALFCLLLVIVGPIVGAVGVLRLEENEEDKE